MKKRFRRLLRWDNTIVLLLSLILCFATSCNDEKEALRDTYGFVMLNVQSDVDYGTPISRADYTDPEDAGEYMVYILQGTDTIESFLYAQAPELLTLEVGDYTASAIWGEDIPAAIGKDLLYMEDMESFIIKEDEITSIELNPIPANAKVDVDFSPELAEVYTDYTLYMSTSHTGNNPLAYEKDQTLPAFFKVNPQNEQLGLSMILRHNQTDYQFDYSVDIEPRDHIILKIDLEEDEDGGEDPGPEVPEAPSIGVNPSSFEFAGEGGTVKAEITTNSENLNISVNADWISVIENGGNLTITVKENNTEGIRTGAITLVALLNDQIATTSVVIIQNSKIIESKEQPYIIAVTESITAEKLDQSVSVRTNTEDWRFEKDEKSDWLNIQQGNGQISFKAENNTTSEDRVATVILIASLNDQEARDTIEIIQTVFVPAPTISADRSLSFGSAGETKDLLITVSEKAVWKVLSVSEDWLTAVENGDKLSISVDPAPAEESRSAVITLEASNSKGQAYHSITITQKGLDKPVLKVTVTINKDILDEVVLSGYEVEDVRDIAEPKITCVGFTNGNQHSIKEGSARSIFVTMQVPEEIQSCILKENGVSYDLAEKAEELGLIYNPTNTLLVLYLDPYLNQLEPDTYSIELSVVDKKAQTASVILNLKVE